MQEGFLATGARAERRVTSRVLKQWRACASEKLPAWDEVRALDLGDDWRACFALDLALSDPDPYFIYLGEDLERFTGTYLREQGAPERAAIDLVSARIDEAVMTRRDAALNEIVRVRGGKKLAFRCVVLPLSENGADVTHVFGAANGRLR